jgi:DNA-binding CsgD family transcriptional regulator
MSNQLLEQPKPLNHTRKTLLQGVLEGISDGILVLSEQGELIYSNYCAYRLCQQIEPTQSKNFEIPDQIWQCCRALMDSRTLYPDRPVVIESEIVVSRSHSFRVRAKWLTLEDPNRPYLAVLLEDRCQSLRNRVFAEVQKYNLTPRQAEVLLLYRSGYSYREIAAELYITINTVRQHLKDINMRRQRTLDLEFG